jgi:uncharacterized caspase-like protein
MLLYKIIVTCFLIVVSIFTNTSYLHAGVFDFFKSGDSGRNETDTTQSDNKATKTTKFNGKVAIITEKLQGIQINVNMQARCKRKSDPQLVQVNSRSFTVDMKDVPKQLFTERLKSMFDKVSAYDNIKSIKNPEEYDFILVPYIHSNFSYDEKAATTRYISEKKFEYKSSPFNIFANIVSGIEILDSQTSKIEHVKISKNGESSINSFFCYDLFTDDLLAFHKADSVKVTSQLFSKTTEEAIGELVTSLEASLRPLALAKSQQRALPSSLSLALRFSDESSFSPNSTLDAGEEAQVFVTVRNDGKGAGYDTILKVSSENPKLSVDREIPLGDIPPGETKEVKVPVKAALDLPDGVVPLTITCSEKRGYDCKKYTLNVPSSRYEKPSLAITGYRINDGNTGLARGNGNGIPENGETVEIIPLIANTGTGPAHTVQVSLASLSSGLETKQGSVTIPRISPGQTMAGNLSFAIPSTFSGKGIDFTITAKDARDSQGTNKQFALATEINQPSLAYTYRIIDQKGNPRSDIQNGESAEIEIRPSNKGRMEAKNIAIELASDAVSFSKARDEIIRIAPQADYTPMRFPFQVPRVTDKKSANITLKLTQRDFPGLTDTINIPVRLTRPEFRITHQIVDQNGNGILEQGESADLLIRVENTGQLDAENVTLSLAVNQKGVNLTSPKEFTIGRIDAGKSSEPKHFSLAIQRIADAGNLPLAFTVTEKTFGSTPLTLALAISPEKAEVITVKGQEQPKPTMVAAAPQNMPPMVMIFAPAEGTRVASEAVTLQGAASDDKGVLDIAITVNGRKMDARGLKVAERQKTDPRQRPIFDTIPLAPGKNTITVTAYDTDHMSTSQTVTVYREAKTGTIYAAVIGINRYKDTSLTLKYARNDAQAFADYLRNHLGLNSTTLFELYDEQATTQNVRSLLGTRLRQRASRPEDTVYIFFAGHGAPEQDTAAKDEDKITKYILTHEADKDNLYGTAVPMDEIAGIFARLGAERVIFIVDSCYSGAGGGRTILAQRSRAVLSDEFLNRLSQGKGRIILTSSRPNETSQESDELKHGFFTYYLLEGLKGAADYDKNGIVDLDEISLYLNKTVPDKTRGAQNPVKKGEAEGQVVVGRVR